MKIQKRCKKKKLKENLPIRSKKSKVRSIILFPPNRCTCSFPCTIKVFSVVNGVFSFCYGLIFLFIKEKIYENQNPAFVEVFLGTFGELICLIFSLFFLGVAKLFSLCCESKAILQCVGIFGILYPVCRAVMYATLFILGIYVLVEYDSLSYFVIFFILYQLICIFFFVSYICYELCRKDYVIKPD